jgi:16S rRNA (guanine527-N7)-methyltransferase
MTLEIVVAGAARLGIALDQDQVCQLERFVTLLLVRNQQVNLTRIVEPAEVERRHLLDSLTCALPVRDALVDGAPWRCIDVGSGGGLPGIPLAIVFPALRMTLLESVGKKSAFLRDAVAELGLPGVTIQTARAEDAARDHAERDGYDLVVGRALAPLPVALEWCLPFAQPGGVVVLPRGSDLPGQLRDGRFAAGQLAGRLREPIPLDDPDLPTGRSLVVADKLGPTPKRFPRRPGLASKQPLTGSQESGVRSQE